MKKAVFLLVLLFGLSVPAFAQTTDSLENIIKIVVSETQPQSTNNSSVESLSKEEAKELECLAKNIYYEARSESWEGKVAVAQVTVNRTINPNFPNNICGVVYQKTKASSGKLVCQFSWHCQGHSKFKINLSQYKESLEVAKQVLFGGVELKALEHALYFHEYRARPGWKLKKVARVGNHIFYKPHRTVVQR